jgi:hypothetical protein
MEWLRFPPFLWLGASGSFRPIPAISQVEPGEDAAVGTSG